MRKFQIFSKKQFEFNLVNIKIKNQLGGWLDISNEIDGSKEYVYSMKTKNKAVDILIYSSVHQEKSKTRDYGMDMVRIVLRWKTKNGYLYKKIAHHQRIDTLFDNLETTLKTTSANVFNLDRTGWVNSLQEI